MTSNCSAIGRLPRFDVRDLFSSIVVFLVALPLCMGIAIASGYPPEAGIISGVIGGLIVAALGGSPLQITGPAAGLAVIVLDLLGKLGHSQLSIVILVAGCLQMLCGSLGLAQWFRAVPPSVIHGMLSGIGLLIFAGQFHVMIDDTPKGTGLNNLLSIPSGLVKVFESISNPSDNHDVAAVLGLATIITVLLWQRFVHRRLPYIHGALVAVTLATLVAYLWHAPVKYVAIPKDLRACFDILQSSDLGATPLITVLGNGLMVAFIASAETLLTAAALDKLYPRSKTDFDRELFAQGVGNMCAGFIGVLPVTGVMARSGTNAAAGAQSRMSAVLHGAWLLLFVVTFPWLLKLVPTASLAALLVYIGLKMANLGVWKEISKYGKSEVATYFATLGLIVCTDLLTGVLAGIALAISSLIYRFTHLDVVVNKDSENNRTDITLHGAATFLRLPNLARVLDDVEPGTELHVHLDRLNYIDHACLDLLLSWDKQHQASGGRLVIDWNALDSMYQDRRTSVRDDGIRQFRRVEPAVQVCETEVR